MVILIHVIFMLNVAVQWLDIHLRVKQMIRSVFEAAAAVHPEMHSMTSRAMYGVDVMIDSHYQPKLLEVWCRCGNFYFVTSGIEVTINIILSPVL